MCYWASHRDSKRRLERKNPHSAPGPVREKGEGLVIGGRGRSRVGGRLKGLGVTQTFEVRPRWEPHISNKAGKGSTNKSQDPAPDKRAVGRKEGCLD